MTVDEIDFTMLARTGLAPQMPKAGEIIFHEGDDADRMYVVREGEVEIVRGDTVVDTVGPGGLFGEMALIDGSSRSASARAKTACELVPIDERTFLFLVEDTPYFALYVMRFLAQRVRAMNELI